MLRTLSFALLLVAAACSQSKSKEAPGAASGSAVPAAGSSTAKSAAAGSGSAAAGSGSDTAASPAAKTVVAGPHASIDDYCKAVLASVEGAETCKYGPDEDMCSCDRVTKDDVSGPLEAKGTGAIKAATLVRAARSASDYVKCELALQLAGGWFVHPETFECGPAPAGTGEGQSTDLKITTFAITGDTVELAYTASHGNYEIDGKGNAKPTQSKPEKHALICKLAADRNVTCSPKQ